MKLGWILCVALAFLLSAQACRADWEVVTRDGRDYVTLKSFCDFYHFPYPGVPQGDTVRLKNAQFSLSLRLDSREAHINGIRYWLSFGIRATKDDWLLSKVDLVKLFEPVLRPVQIDSKRPVLGVVIDPGHGGSDNGATSSRGSMEKNLTLDTALRLEKILRDAGYKTVMTRRSDVYVDLYERAQRAAAYNGYIFVSLHYNSASPDARGLETYACSPRGAGSTMAGGSVTRADYQKVPGNDNDSLSALLASEVHRCITTLNPGDPDADRGVKRARFVVLRQNTVPGILVEGGFLSNRMEASALASVPYRQKLAEAVAKGIFNYAALMLPPEKRVTAPQVRPATETPKPTPTPAPAPSSPKPATTTASTSKPVKPTPAAPKPAVTTASTSVTPAPAPTPAPTTTISTPETPAATPEKPAEPAAAPTPSAPAPATEPEKPAETKPAETTTPSTPAGEEKPAPTMNEPEPPTTIYPDHSGTGPAPTEPRQPEAEQQP